MTEHELESFIKDYSDDFDYSKKETAIILAAGHGKRIKSNTSKMLHKIWQTPTVERVINASANGLRDPNIIVVVGIKAEDVIRSIGKRKSLVYAYQKEQKGTGHAVQMGLDKIDFSKYDGTVYVFPGDMGLIDTETVSFFKEEFYKSNSDMMVLTGIYEGNISENHYGRIIREKQIGKKSSAGANVLEIMEFKDIAELDNKNPYVIKLKSKKHSYTKKELLENREYNSGVFAFRFKPLFERIKKIENNNVQNEIYLTDLIALFNGSGYKVAAVSPVDQKVVMGFNTKSVLLEMDNFARQKIYERIKDIVTIDDPNDFFIDENVVDSIVEMDKNGILPEIRIGKGAFLGKGVQINTNLNIGRNTTIIGNVVFGKNISVGENSHLSCYYGQAISIGNNCEIHGFCTIKGNISLDENCVIESNVRLTGSDDAPTYLGKKVTVKGVSYIFGSRIGDNILIQHSTLIKKNVNKPDNYKPEIFKVKFYSPEPEGGEGVQDLIN